MTSGALRQQQGRLTLTLDGVSLGVWDDRTGGDTDSNSTQYFLGGMGPRISLGGQQQVNNVIVQVLFTDTIQALAKWIISRAGKGKLTVSEQPLDDEGNALGDPFVWTGRLKRAKSPERGANNNNAALMEVELEVTGPMG